MKFNKIILSGILFLTSSVFGAPQTPPNGGSGVSNCTGCTTTVTSAINLPADINLQNAYNQSVSKQIVFPLGQGIAFLNSSLQNQFIISDVGTIGFNNFVVSKDGNSGVSIYGTEDPVSTIFQVKSSVFGSNPYPYMTQAQEDLIDLTDAKPGWGVFNTDDGVYDVYTGSEKQQLLTAQHVTGSGAVTVTNDGHGSIDIFSSGGATPDAAYSSFSTQNNSAATTFPGINTFKPVYLGTLFSGDNSTDFSNSFLIIDSVSTPIMTYTGATTQAFDVHESFSIRGAVATTATFKFCIAVRLANGTVQVTDYCQLATASDLINFIPGPKLEGNITLATGDSVFAEAQNITNTNSIYAAFSNFLVSSVAGSIPDTNGLPQGSNNKYLSTDGGTTLASATGAITAGRVAQFSGTSGLVSDSGIPAANVIQSTGSYSNPAWITSLASSKISGLSAFSLVGTDASGLLTNNVQNITPNIRGVNIVNNFTPLVGAQVAVEFSSSLLYGNYLSFGGFGPYMGIDSATNGLFIAGNAYYDATSHGFFRFNTGSSGAIRVNAAGAQIQHMITGTGFTPASLVTDFSDDGLGNLNLPHATASQLLATDASKDIISVPSAIFTAFVTVTGSTQAISPNTQYFNNYSGGQAVYTLPNAPPLNTIVSVVGLHTASTAGWVINAQGSDQIQFASSLSAAAGSVTSTVGSSTDSVVMVYASANLWVVMSAVGLNFTVV